MKVSCFCLRHLTDPYHVYAVIWLRKYLTQSPEWAEFANYYKIDNIIWTGPKYHKSLTSIHNPFWESVKNAFSSWYRNLDDCGLIDIEHQPIWGNTHLNIPMNMDMFRNNIIFIKDLFDEQGLPRTLDSLEQAIGKTLMFLTYHAIWRAIPKNGRIACVYLPKMQIYFCRLSTIG